MARVEQLTPDQKLKGKSNYRQWVTRIVLLLGLAGLANWLRPEFANASE